MGTFGTALFTRVGAGIDRIGSIQKFVIKTINANNARVVKSVQSGNLNGAWDSVSALASAHGPRFSQSSFKMERLT